MKLAFKKIIAKEFLIIVLILIILVVYFILLSIENVYNNYKCNQINKEIFSLELDIKNFELEIKRKISAQDSFFIKSYDRFKVGKEEYKSNQLEVLFEDFKNSKFNTFKDFEEFRKKFEVYENFEFLYNILCKEYDMSSTEFAIFFNREYQENYNHKIRIGKKIWSQMASEFEKSEKDLEHTNLFIDSITKILDLPNKIALRQFVSKNLISKKDSLEILNVDSRKLSVRYLEINRNIYLLRIKTLNQIFLRIGYAFVILILIFYVGRYGYSAIKWSLKVVNE
jgi:hypothetical protein